MDESTGGSESLEDRVIDLINGAITAQSEKEKVKNLLQVQELIIHQSDDILDNFLDEVIAFQSSKSAEVRKFVAGFLEQACLKDNECFSKLIVNLKFLVLDENANVVKKAIQTATQLYRLFLKYVVKAARVTDEMSSTWDEWTQIKESICSLIEASENEGIKTQAIKFMETIVVCQTPPDQWSTNEDVVPLEKLIAKQITTSQQLEDEANRFFDQLVVLHGTVHISSVNLMACMQSLVLIAKQRSHLFMGKVIQALEALHANLPPTLAKSQVNSVRKSLKLQLLSLLKHPAAAAQYQTIVIELLTDLGTLPPDLHKCISEARKRAPDMKISAPEAKKIKLEPTEKQSKSKSNSDAHNAATTAFQPRISRSDAMTAIDLTSQELKTQLELLENVTDLVLVSLLDLPDSMPSHFQASYTPVGNTSPAAQVEHISRLLATQFTSAGLGSGVEEFVKRLTTSSASSQQTEPEPQQIATLVGMMAQEVKKQEQQQEKQHRQHQETRVKLIPTGKTEMTAVKLKHVSLAEITKALSPEEQEKMICAAMNRILAKEESALFMSPAQSLQRHNVISRLCCLFRVSSANLFDLVMDHVLQDMRTRYEILLDILYEMFLQSKISKSGSQEYEDCFSRILYAIVDRTEVRDRDHFIAKLLLEAPLLTEPSINFFKAIIENEKDASSVEQCFATIDSLLKSRKVARKPVITAVLQLSVCPSKPEIRTRSLECVRQCHQKYDLEVKEQIESFCLQMLNNLKSEKPPEFLSSDAWTEELTKICLMPYLQLVSHSQKLIHGLASAYVSATADVKRVILRSIEGPIRGMGMNSPELLILVENFPKGAETLITRIIHVLTDKQQPSPELVVKVRDVYRRRVADVRFLIPVVNGLSKKEVIEALPKLIKLNPVVVKEVFSRLLGISYGEDYTLNKIMSFNQRNLFCSRQRE